MTAPAVAPDWSLLPLRRGRHRNKALAAYRRTKAIEMVTHGATYQEAADELGYANRGTVHRIVQQSLAAHEVASVETLRDVEVRRLDALQVGLSEAAMAGDVEAAHACLRIIPARVKVLGLAEPSIGQRPRCQQPQTVILQKEDCRLRGCPEHT